MASGQKSSDDTKRFLTTRRSVLKLAGAAGITAVTAGAATAAPSGDFDRTVNLGNQGLSTGDTIDSYLEEHFTSGTKVTIPAGEYNWDGSGFGGNYSNAAVVGDGDVILNRPAPEVVVRQTIGATSGTVTLQNITIHGKAGFDQSKFRLAADSGAEIVVNNFNMPHGTVQEASDSMGFYAGQDHAGKMTFKNSYFSNFGNLALYLKAPGNPGSGAGGAVEVTNCVFVNNNAAAVKFGSSDSYVHDSLIVNDETAPGAYNGAVSQRGIKIDVPGDNVVVENMDIYHTEAGCEPIELDDDGAGGSGVIRNCRIHNDSNYPVVEEKWDTQGSWEATGLDMTGSGNLSVPSHFQNLCTGDGCAVPNLDPQADRSSGDGTSGDGSDTGSSGGSSDDGTSDSGGSSLPDGTPLEVIAADGGPKFQYEFTVDGDAAKVTTAGNLASEGNDSITKTDGQAVVSGATGNGFGDSYRVTGPITRFTVNTEPSNLTVNLDSTDVTSDLIDTTGQNGDNADSGGSSDDSQSSDTRSVEVLAADGGPKFQYEFTVDGEATKVISAGNLAAESNDSITTSNGQSVVAGEVGNGFGDSFEVTGALSAFSATTDAANFTVSVDGTDVTSDLVGDSSDSGQSGDGTDDTQSGDGSNDTQSGSGSDGQTEQRPNLLIIDGTRSTNVANYSFEVTGTVKRSSEHSTARNGGAKWDTIIDEVSDSSAVGVVGEAKDAYRFSGELKDIEIRGDARAIIKEA